MLTTLSSTLRNLLPRSQPPTTTTSTTSPKLLGKIILITGATSPLGTTTLLHLCTLSPAEIYFTSRSPTAARALIARAAVLAPLVVLTHIHLDLTSLLNVKKAITTHFRNTRLHLLICCASTNAKDTLSANSLTKDGYERNMGVNYLSHALIIKLLLPTLLRTAESRPTADVRVVMVTSPAFRRASGVQFAKARRITAEHAGSYAESRFAEVVYNSALAVRYEKILAVTVLTGGNVGLARWMLGRGESAENVVWAATAERRVGEGKVGSGVYGPVGVPENVGFDGKLMDELWEWTERELRRF